MISDELSSSAGTGDAPVLTATAPPAELSAARWLRRGNEQARVASRACYEEAVRCYGLGLVAETEARDCRVRGRLLSCRAHVLLLLGGEEAAKQALHDCSEALVEDPKNAETYWRGAKACQRLQLMEKAADFCRNGLAKTSGGSTDKLRKLLQEVEVSDQSTCPREGEKDMACTQTGFELREGSAKDFRATMIASLQAAVEADPHDADAWCNLGVVEAEQGNVEKAMASFSAAVRANPSHAAAQRNLGEALRHRGDLAPAERALREALRLAPDEAAAETCCGLGATLGLQGNFHEAIMFFRKALDAEPGHGEASLGLGIALEKLGEARDAVQSFRLAVKAIPRNASAHHNLGVALERRSQQGEEELKPEETQELLEEAEVALWTACSLDRTNAESQCQLGVVLMRLRKLNDAKKAFEAAVELDPAHAGALENLQALYKLCVGLRSVCFGKGSTEPTQTLDVARLHAGDGDFAADADGMVMKDGLPQNSSINSDEIEL
eukprot:TRINITY_DN44848_c0_g1_i1.p1 TRINITY_DN44848_c0_g1~~TRINITY_DN44848_c0_g1_i1.p1  ORF type:complete len:497 (-),score=96.95 TRINITY_DN44848_c0_g1_i1:110-1600(-)